MRSALRSQFGVALACLVVVVAGVTGGAAAADVIVAFEEQTVTVEQGERATLTIQFEDDRSEVRLGVVGPDGENRTGRQLVDADGDGAVRVRVDTTTTGDGFLTVLGNDTSTYASFAADDDAARPLAPGRYELRLSVDGVTRDVGVLAVERAATETTASPTPTATTTPNSTTTAPNPTATTAASTVPIPGFGPAVAAAAIALAGLAAVARGRGGRR